MKQLFFALTIACLFFLQGTAQPVATPAPAQEVLSAALKTAGAQKKNVLLMFHASWCGWCHRMDTSLNDPAVKPFFDKYFVITHLVVHESAAKKHLENPGAEAMKDQYHGKGKGIPFWLVFDPQGNLIADSRIRAEGQGPDEGENSGCPASGKEVSYFITILKKSTSLTDTELEIIRKRFRENDH